jgi:diketogulonate reductase-like aldo/keto reductase
LNNILSAALKKGYMHIDTAFIYQNEETIGKTLKKWLQNGGNRSQVFITSKVNNN